MAGYICNNCNHTHKIKEWIRPCSKCGKEICEACELTIFTVMNGSTECFECRDKENKGEACSSCNGKKFIKQKCWWSFVNNEYMEVKCPKCNYRSR